MMITRTSSFIAINIFLIFSACTSSLVESGMDNECIVGALLHDVVEDTQYDLEYIRKEFGDEVALLVDGVTKLGQIPSL